MPYYYYYIEAFNPFARFFNWLGGRVKKSVREKGEIELEREKERKKESE